MNIIEGILSSLRIILGRKKSFSILKDVSGIIKPSRMTLLLGPPSSGKTTLLLALTGKLDPSLKVRYITYFFITASYISQHDLHIGEMTVSGIIFLLLYNFCLWLLKIANIRLLLFLLSDMV
ncbi:hypothetical protein ACJIZ3_008915 [Penstemon smallii]|uniref:ABC transporter domain-containing protein n=1 Tax=Penstemon smallii TaxID=265156 RepID=A0ABD3TB63_9LAMI